MQVKNAVLILSKRARAALEARVQTSEPHDIAKDWDRDNPKPKIIAKYTSRELMRTPNFGWVSLAEVIAWLDEYSLRLADDPKRKRCPHCGQLMRNRQAPQ